MWVITNGNDKECCKTLEFMLNIVRKTRSDKVFNGESSVVHEGLESLKLCEGKDLAHDIKMYCELCKMMDKNTEHDNFIISALNLMYSAKGSNSDEINRLLLLSLACDMYLGNSTDITTRAVVLKHLVFAGAERGNCSYTWNEYNNDEFEQVIRNAVARNILHVGEVSDRSMKFLNKWDKQLAQFATANQICNNSDERKWKDQWGCLLKL
jgi:hypothetical protein